MKRFTLVVFLMFVMLFGVMVGQVWAKDGDTELANNEVFDLLQSKVNFINLVEKTDDQLKAFMLVASLYLTQSDGAKYMDRKTYEGFMNLLFHMTKTCDIIYLRKKMKKEEYSEYYKTFFPQWLNVLKSITIQ